MLHSISLIILTLLAKYTKSWPTCSVSCGGVCSSAENPHCGNFDTNWNACSSCADGYWSQGEEYICADCLSTLGCSDCADFKGCVTCDYGGTKMWSAECNAEYCDGAGDEPISSDTTIEPSTDTQTDTSDTVTDSTTSDDDTSDSNVTVISTGYAIAKFDDNGIYGSVVVTQGNIFVYLNFSEFNFDSNWYDVGGEQCLKGGLYYSINEKWSYSSALDRVGPSECSASKTGSRWDPWMACSTDSHNEYCKDYYDSSADGCVPPYSFNDDGNYNDELSYSCSEYTYADNPFTCEIGDLSGKYGRLTYDSQTKTMISHGSSPYEVDALDMTGKSILFRCGFDNSRALCGTFEAMNIDSDANDDYIYDKHLTKINSISEKPIQNLTYSKIAHLSDNSFVKLTYYHKYQISINLRELAIPGSCGDEILYRIFTETSSQCKKSELDSFFDPTITCNENSNNEDKGYCIDSDLCGDTSYLYKCENSGFYQSIDRFLCGPGDLSNKYGSIDISDGSSYIYNASGYDDLMIPLSLLDGKSIVLECESNGQVIACGEFEDYTDDTDLYSDHIGDATIISSNNNDNDDNDSNSSSNDSILGVSNTVGLVMLILLILTIIPCIRAICKKKKERERTRNNNNNNNEKHEKNKKSMEKDMATVVGMNNSLHRSNSFRSTNTVTTNNTRQSHREKPRLKMDDGMSESVDVSDYEESSNYNIKYSPNTAATVTTAAGGGAGDSGADTTPTNGNNSARHSRRGSIHSSRRGRGGHHSRNASRSQSRSHSRRSSHVSAHSMHSQHSQQSGHVPTKATSVHGRSQSNRYGGSSNNNSGNYTHNTMLSQPQRYAQAHGYGSGYNSDNDNYYNDNNNNNNNNINNGNGYGVKSNSASGYGDASVIQGNKSPIPRKFKPNNNNNNNNNNMKTRQLVQQTSTPQGGGGGAMMDENGQGYENYEVYDYYDNNNGGGYDAYDTYDAYNDVQGGSAHAGSAANGGGGGGGGIAGYGGGARLQPNLHVQNNGTTLIHSSHHSQASQASHISGTSNLSGVTSF